MLNGKNILLYPFSLLYGLITGIRNLLYNKGLLRSFKFQLPVICVGNITVGGTGKTPHTEYLAVLLGKNFKVATLSRGYKRKTSDFRIATSSSVTSDIGDEPMQMFHKLPGITVAVDRDRVNGVRKIQELMPGIEVIILDDAFQHRKIVPGFSILLSDFERPLHGDHMLPYGNLRESRRNISRADIILITKSPEDISLIQRESFARDIDKSPNQHLFFTTVKYYPPVPVFAYSSSGNNSSELPFGDGCGIVLITGIANPRPLKEYLQKRFNEIIHLSYPDHYYFKEKDNLKFFSAYNELKSPERYLVTTEKDAVRLKEFSDIEEPVKSAFYYIPVGIDFLNNDKNEFDNLIVDYVRKNKRNDRLSETERDN